MSLIQNWLLQGVDWLLHIRSVIIARSGSTVRMHSHARTILEEKILPYYASGKQFNKILFIGCDPYTAHYELLFKSKEYWTIDSDSKKRHFGSQRHIVDTIQNLHLHFEPGYFDAIICNGVYGWGLNTKNQCEAGFSACYFGLRDGGEFILGWNDIEKYRPVPLEEIDSISKFQEKHFTPLETSRYLPHIGCHIYAFYVKARAAETFGDVGRDK